MRKILLIGNPNVGKSVVFARLTGVQVMTSNYAGTTVEYRKGFMKLADEKFEVIDLPGTYSLEPTSKAEEVTRDFLEEAFRKDKDLIVLNVVDSTNLERNLHLTLDLIDRGYPVMAALNMCDELKHRGVEVDFEKIESLLGAPVIATCGVTALGVRQLKDRLSEVKLRPARIRTHDELWQAVGEIILAAQKLTHKHHNWREFLEDLSIHPVSGVAIGIIVIYAVFKIVRFIGEGLTTYLLDPVFNNIYAPLLMKLSAFLGQNNFLHHVLIGDLLSGTIDYKNSAGLLTTAPYVEFNLVLPYIISFYLVLGLLEDIGYLPRFALLLDAVMHRLGLHGFAIIPILLGFGCNVPGIMATRVLESKRERFIASTLISIAVPCAALQAMMLRLLSPFGIYPLIIVYASLFFVWVVIGFILNHSLKGYSPELVLEIPPYRFPPADIFFSKLWIRVREFIFDALPYVMLGVVIINLLQYIHIFEIVSDFFAPVMKAVLGLPKDAIFPLCIGFLRKDIAAGLLIPLGLSIKQLIIACVVLSMSFPCIATFVIFLKELGWKYLLAGIAIMAGVTLLVGGILNIIL